MQETEFQEQQLMEQKDQRLIEAGFPCHQVGAETQRERGASSALPPLYFLHVWWARRPLVPSRAAVLASLLPAETDSESFIKGLGIVRYQAIIGEKRWVLARDTLKKRIKRDGEQLYLEVDKTVLQNFHKEQERRTKRREQIAKLEQADNDLAHHSVIKQWKKDVQPLPETGVHKGILIPVEIVSGDPADVKEKIEFAKRKDVSKTLEGNIQWDPEDSYGYSRAFATPVKPVAEDEKKVVLDPTAGGGSIPFEALRLGHQVIANEYNPIASVILKATLEYPFRFGKDLIQDISRFGQRIRETVENQMAPFTPFSSIPKNEHAKLESHLKDYPELVDEHTQEYDHMGLLYCRQVNCPHCNCEAPLLNSLWLSKEDGDRWGVKVKPLSEGTVRFEPFQITTDTKKETIQALEKGTVSNAVGQCIHCHQAIGDEEIKKQARGESEYGRWQDLLYCIVAFRLEPELDDDGQLKRYASGPRKGEIKTKKVRYFRAPNEKDLQALRDAEDELERRRVDFEMKGVIPNEPFPQGNDMRPVIYGMPTWADMFTSRQLLGHLSTIEILLEYKPQILEELGHERGRAVITYLQFAIDKILDYNSRQTLWDTTRGVVRHVFTRHDFSFKWTFGEMVYAGPSSGLRWAIAQILNSLDGICDLMTPRTKKGYSEKDLCITNSSATNLNQIEDQSVDAVIMDPPYYNNVQYNELSDFFYVWQKRTLGDLYPGWFDSTVTDKNREAVANPVRDGSTHSAKSQYENYIQQIFQESKRVLKSNGIMTLMFTHKTQGAWETLTDALIRSGWKITACYPIESENVTGIHQKDVAAAASSIFISCRPSNNQDHDVPSSWSFDVKTPLETTVREGLTEFEKLNLNPVDRMIASWGKALRVYSENWPVVDGNEEVSPTRAMQEAARVVAEEEVSRISGGHISVDNLDSESRLAVIALGINGLGAFAFDDALQMSKSLNLALQHKSGNYRASPDMVAYNNENDPAKAAPLAKKGSKLRLVNPSERDRRRLESPQTLWDILQGLIILYREGGIVPARNYLNTHGMEQDEALHGLLQVWADECGEEELQREARLLLYEL